MANKIFDGGKIDLIGESQLFTKKDMDIMIPRW
jgi:hypothetical protein